MPMPYLLIRNVDPQTHVRLLKLARARQTSLAEIARDLLGRHLWAQSLRSTKEPRIAAARKTKLKVRRI